MTESGPGFVPNPWYVCFEFFRQILIGFVVTMGRRHASISTPRTHSRANTTIPRAVARHAG